MEHPLVKADYDGMLVIPYYDYWVKWIFDLSLFDVFPVLNFMRDIWIWLVLILPPFVGYLFYRIYWWSLADNIWVP